MAATVSFYNQPYEYNPINAPAWIVTYSDDYVNDGYKYVFNLYSYNRIDSSDYDFLGQYKIPPRPTGEGLFDVHKILKSNINNNASPKINDIVNDVLWLKPAADDSIVKFRYKYGFQQDLVDIFDSTSATYSGLTAYVQLNLASTTDIIAGDIINIEMDAISTNQIYNGQALVLSSATNSIVTSISYGSPESSVGGTITSVQRIVGTSSFMYGLNGTRQYYDASFNDFSEQSGLSDVYTNNHFIFNNIDSSVGFLSNYSFDGNTYKSIFLNNYECVSIISVTQSSYSIVVETFDINKNVIGTFSFGPNIEWGPIGDNDILTATSSTKDYILYTVGCGPVNLLTAEPSIFDNGAVYYTFKYTNGAQYAQLNRKIVDNCSPFNNYRLMFLNRLGGYDFYNFNYDSRLSTSVERKEFNKTLDWNYKIGDRGRSVLTMNAEDQVVITTDWVSEYDYNFLQELVTSPDVYLIDENNLLKIPILVTDTTWEQKTTLRDKMFFMTLTFKYSYSKNLQSY